MPRKARSWLFDQTIVSLLRHRVKAFETWTDGCDPDVAKLAALEDADCLHDFFGGFLLPVGEK